MAELKDCFWAYQTADILSDLQTEKNGLTSEEAAARLKLVGANVLKEKRNTNALSLLLSQFKSPILIILFFAVALSIFLKDTADALIILAIVLISSLLGFWQEYGADNSVKKLLALVQIRSLIRRDGRDVDIGVEDIVPGDIVLLKAGDLVPADCLLIEDNALFVDEATLTGETYPVEKQVALLPAETVLSERKNCLWMGTHVISGTGSAVIVKTGKETEYGKISERLKLRPMETEFERGVRRFGYLLMEITLILVFAIFAINIILKRPPLDAFLFSLALAVGLTPQLLPAIISINLAHGAKMMAAVKVIVKRLAAIENFGSMDILCSDKTGTLTEGMVRLNAPYGIDGIEYNKVLYYAYLNASFESGFNNPIDAAIRSHQPFDIAGYEKLEEEPYDFIRKRLSILLADQMGRQLVVTKGAFQNILDVCTKAETADGSIVDIEAVRSAIEKHFAAFSSKGYRTLGVAYKTGVETLHENEHEHDMTFLGFLTFFDPLKEDIRETIGHLRELGVGLKIITGDNHLVAATVVSQIGIGGDLLTGSDLRQMSDDALIQKAPTVSIFAEVEPNQKERIILALKKAGYVVGYMGDGINDASALHASDVSISVDSAADAAKEAADIVLLEKDLRVLLSGVKAGRVTFANTLKYVFMATSANFGNMFSMAGASLFLPFLPLLPKQILLTNLMTDIPEMTIASDDVDSELISKPRRWDIRFIRRFMVTFGLISSIFDYVTFALLWFFLHATDTSFRTGWFIESVVSAAIIVLIVRTRKPFFKSRPSGALTLAVLLIALIAVAIPYTPLAGLFGFIPMQPWVLLVIGCIVALYIASVESIKKIFYRRV
ncbi:magnesium-translocating P-type ATPase [Oscillospiraceae bacterium CM]|nr:magnesium-translocating P-type ATPase [Oscillospiraceae bacterium CM]